MTRASLAVGGILAVGASLLSVSFADTVPVAPPSPQANPNCTLAVPADPLTARGLAAAYTLTATDPAKGPCRESDAGQAAFVQATVLDPASGAVSVYNPLVVDRGSEPAVRPVVPALPAHAVVGIWFSFNGTALKLTGQTAAGKCTGPSPTQPLGQFASCNAPAFFTAATSAQHTGRLTVPRLGTARDGEPCPTVRDTGLAGHDRTGNVTTEYVTTADGRTAQKTADSTGRLHGGGLIHAAVAPLWAGDNFLLVHFEDPALGCTPWTVPDLADPGSKVTALALDELQAANFLPSPIALVPVKSRTGAEGNQQSAAATEPYPAGGEPPTVGGAAKGDLKAYCMNLATFGAQRIILDKEFTVSAPSPQAGRSLFDFLTQRLAASLGSLGCPQAGASSPTAMPTGAVSPTAMPTGTPSRTPVPTSAPSRTAAPTTVPMPSPSATVFGNHW
ncbi:MULTISPECIES: hypothetical protein [unclassified Kitasatospora]|uniref:hypothetical protein n=1 Tax=unclassified Kitasatospora TaxID=2633591 RepID=UPI00247635F8|nr:hypothetical protein [Kitasatospora sp. MAP12-44]